MAGEIIVPQLGESVTEATISKWFKKPGDAVKQDEPLVELETDKVTVEVNSPYSGVLENVLAQQGQTVSVGAQLGSIKIGAAAQAQPVAQAQPMAASALAAAPQGQRPAPFGFPPSKSSPQVSAPVIPLSPAARKIAAEQGIDPSALEGTGRDGRITKADVLQPQPRPLTEVMQQFQPQPQAPATFTPPPAPVPQQQFQAPVPAAPQAGEERVKMTKLRKRIAERLKESQNTAAILTTFNEVDMSSLMAIRSEYKESFEKKHGVKLGFMSFFVRAAIAALKEIPSVNASIEGDDIIYKNYYHIGVAVGTEQGLVVPVLRNADQLSLAGIEKTISDMGKKAREGKLGMSDLAGGTFTISNGGVYGSLMSTPIINPPQTGILGMHKTQERPVAINGKVEIRPMMYLALSYDHRLIDGKEAVTFLVRIKESIEDPRRLLLDM